jgi:hypothetical protein
LKDSQEQAQRRSTMRLREALLRPLLPSPPQLKSRQPLSLVHQPFP